MRAKNYVGDYEGIDNKILEAKYLGMSRVFVSIQNNSLLNFHPNLNRICLLSIFQV